MTDQGDWAPPPPPALPPFFRRAVLFDGFENGAPVVYRTKLERDEVYRILAYLNAGPAVLFTRSTTKDAYFPDEPPQVPISYETDGLWIWGGAARYYLERYGLPPEPEFLAHIRANNYITPQVPPHVQAAARNAVLAAGAAQTGPPEQALPPEPPTTPWDPFRGPGTPGTVSEPVFIRYYAKTAPGKPVQNPAQILRVLRVPGQLDEVVMHKRGKWRETDAFARVRESGRPDETLVPITPEQASVVLHRWRETRVIPLVEGVEFPSLPETSERAPRPGSGPVNAAAAQAIGDEWVNSSGFSAGRIRAGIWEFDRGYIVYPRLSPQDAQLNVGSARGVIDRATGRLSLWPSYPFPMVAQMYRESRDGDRRYEDGVDEFEEDED